MTNMQIHPSLRRRRAEVQSDRERRYDAIRGEITEDLKRTIGILTTANDKTKFDLINDYIDMARLLYATVEKTPPRSPLSGIVHVGAQHLQNGMVFIENMLKHAVIYTGEATMDNKPCEYEMPKMQVEFLQQEKILREQIVTFLRSAD